MKLSENLYIVPLSKRYLNQAVKLVKSTFKDEGKSLKRELEASVDVKKFIKYCKKYDEDIKTLEYFIAIDSNEKVLGIIGLYSTIKDYEDTSWIGWYCVEVKQRRKGIGKGLLNYVIKEAKKRKKKYLCLYTSTYKDEAAAQKIYDQYEFHITKKVHKKGYEILYRKKAL